MLVSTASLLLLLAGTCATVRACMYPSVCWKCVLQHACTMFVVPCALCGIADPVYLWVYIPIGLSYCLCCAHSSCQVYWGLLGRPCNLLSVHVYMCVHCCALTQPSSVVFVEGDRQGAWGGPGGGGEGGCRRCVLKGALVVPGLWRLQAEGVFAEVPAHLWCQVTCMSLQ
jgi:hypothetical protein